MKQCVNDIVAFGMNETELQIMATVAIVAVSVYMFKLIHKYS